MKLGLSTIALAALLGSSLSLATAARAQQQQSPVPDAPTPQAPRPLSSVDGPITPGMGASSQPSQSAPSQPAASSSSPAAQPQSAPRNPAPASPAKDELQAAPPELPAAGEGIDKITTLIRLHVNYVDVPVTVKDAKGKLVAGLTWRDFRVYENDTLMHLDTFTVDPAPLSVAFVIDQSLTSDVMAKVNNSLGAIQGALTPYDEIAVFSYNNGAQERTGFTGAQSARVPAVLAMTKATGADMLVPVSDGPLAGCSVRQNGSCVDPNLQPGRSAGGSTFMTIPKEIHTLNDAILAAAKELSTRPKERRRIIYVISDGKEYGSKAKFSEVLRYLEHNKTAVYGTAVGESARWGEGYIDRFHIPLTSYENILIKYTQATGGTLDAAGSINSIEKSYARIAEEARTKYLLGYYSHEPSIDGKFRKVEVRVDRPGLTVSTINGYYPSAQDVR